MKKLTVILLIFAAIFAGCSSDDTDKTSVPEADKVFVPEAVEISLVTSDSLTQTGWFVQADSSQGKAPLIITLPMINKTHNSFDKFVRETMSWIDTVSTAGNQIRPHFLNLDLRGHGLSTMRGSEKLAFMSMKDADYARIPLDVAEITSRVLGDYGHLIDSSFIVVVGASIGANAALILTREMPFIKKVVALSAGEDYRSMKPGEAFVAYEGQALFVVCQGDVYSFESTGTLTALKKDNWLTKLYFGKNHGSAILKENGVAMSAVIEWIFGEEVEPADN